MKGGSGSTKSDIKERQPGDLEVKKSRKTQQTVWVVNDRMDSGKLSSDYYNINHIKLATIAGSVLNIVHFLIC